MHFVTIGFCNFLSLQNEIGFGHSDGKKGIEIRDLRTNVRNGSD